MLYGERSGCTPNDEAQPPWAEGTTLPQSYAGTDGRARLNRRAHGRLQRGLGSLLIWLGSP